MRPSDADKLEKSLQLSIASWSRDRNSNAPVIVRTYKDVLSRLGHAPVLDVVEVIRCADCDNYDPDEGSCAIRFDERGEPLGVLSTGYCSDGMREPKRPIRRFN